MALCHRISARSSRCVAGACCLVGRYCRRQIGQSTHLQPSCPPCLPAVVSFVMLYTCEEPRRGGTEAALREQFEASQTLLAVSCARPLFVACWSWPLCSGRQHLLFTPACCSPPAVSDPPLPLQEHSRFVYDEQLTWRKLGHLLLIPTNVMVIFQVGDVAPHSWPLHCLRPGQRQC